MKITLAGRERIEGGLTELIPRAILKRNFCKLGVLCPTACLPEIRRMFEQQEITLQLPQKEEQEWLQAFCDAYPDIGERSAEVLNLIETEENLKNFGAQEILVAGKELEQGIRQLRLTGRFIYLSELVSEILKERLL